MRSDDPTIKNRTGIGFGTTEIPVEFLVLHYTACSLEDTLKIFCEPPPTVCSHLVLDLDGTVYDLGGFWNGPIFQGAHAGESHFELDGRLWEAFNRFSIGVEIINFNGNLISYTQEQYASLQVISKHFQSRFPALLDPNRILGHEHIAGFRGKVDPGRRFDWNLFYTKVFSGSKSNSFPDRSAVLNDFLWSEFQREFGRIDFNQMKPKDWSVLSANLEAFVGKSKSLLDKS